MVITSSATVKRFKDASFSIKTLGARSCISVVCIIGKRIILKLSSKWKVNSTSAAGPQTQKISPEFIDSERKNTALCALCIVQYKEHLGKEVLQSIITSTTHREQCQTTLIDGHPNGYVQKRRPDDFVQRHEQLAEQLATMKGEKCMMVYNTRLQQGVLIYECGKKDPNQGWEGKSTLF